MASFALEHKKRILIELIQAKELHKKAVSYHEKSQKAREDSPDFSMACDSIQADCDFLSSQPQGEIRNARKREFIQKYLHQIVDYEGKGEPYANPVLVQVMIWAFDVGDIGLANRLAKRCIVENQPMPERFKRDVRTYVADAIFEHSATIKNKELKLNFLLDNFEQIKNNPIHDDIKSKYAKTIATLCFDLKEYQKAKDFFDLTQVFNPQAKIQTALKALEKFL